jgi:hypothetical protein
MESSDFENMIDFEHYMTGLAELNKNLKLKLNKPERLKFLKALHIEYKLSEINNKLMIKMIERIYAYEREFPSGPEYPLDPPLKSEKINGNKKSFSPFIGVKIKKLFLD